MEYKEVKEVLRRIRKSIREEELKKTEERTRYPPESEKMGLSRRGRKRKYQSKTEKQRAYRGRKKSRDILSIS